MRVKEVHQWCTVKGGKQLTKNKRLCVALPPELEKRIYNLRKTEKYCRMTISEIMRTLILRGLESEKEGV